jgi:adenylate kinase
MCSNALAVAVMIWMTRHEFARNLCGSHIPFVSSFHLFIFFLSFFLSFQQEFLHSSDVILGSAPAGIILVVGGPGSGKGVLSNRLVKECGVIHLSSGDLLRDEVRRDTVLGKQVREIMERGELVSSAVIVTLIRRVMRNHPGKRVLLDGFPRSIQNAHDLVELCGVPELALHLECDDTILMERILKRGAQATDMGSENARADDNIHTALKRLRTYHKYHNSTLEWLREQHVPVVNLDCSGSADGVWEQLCAIGRLMRPATRIDASSSSTAAAILPNGLMGERGTTGAGFGAGGGEVAEK